MPIQEKLYRKDGAEYVFEDDQLIQFQGVKAEGLSTYDDLELIENHLWGTKGPKGDQDLCMKPLHKLSMKHINAIITDYNRGCLEVKREYINYWVDMMTPF